MLTIYLPFQAVAQTSFRGQANSAEEFDAYLLVLRETAPNKIVAATSEFARRWPQSEMLAQIFELESEAYSSMGDAKSTVQSGEKALAAAPDNLAVLANLAYTIANSATHPQQLARAEQYAQRVLELSQKIQIPRKITPQDWQETRNHLTSTAHAALGLIAYKRGNNRIAIRELETAVGTECGPSPAHYYRLGLLYQVAGNQSKAIQMLQKAAAAGDPTIRQLAEARLQSISGKK